jgi:hypothetical protein
MKRTYTGRCHCGAVAYEADLDLESGTARCNCTFCAKHRSWVASGQPGDLRVTKGEEALGRYAAREGAGYEHCFCATCGIRVFSRGEIEGMGPFMTVQVATLDEAPEALREVSVAFQDGRHDNWWNPPEDTRGL